jgi:hypothetical protein
MPQFSAGTWNCTGRTGTSTVVLSSSSGNPGNRTELQFLSSQGAPQFQNWKNCLELYIPASVVGGL